MEDKQACREPSTCQKLTRSKANACLVKLPWRASRDAGQQVHAYQGGSPQLGTGCVLDAGEDGAIDVQEGPAAAEEMILHTTQPLTQDGRGTGGADQSDVQAVASEGSQDVDIGGTVSPKKRTLGKRAGDLRLGLGRLPGMLCWLITSPSFCLWRKAPDDKGRAKLTRANEPSHASICWIYVGTRVHHARLLLAGHLLSALSHTSQQAMRQSHREMQA